MIFALLLYKYTGQEKIAISYPVGIKEAAGLMYGAAVNTNIFAYKVNTMDSIVDSINSIRTWMQNIKNSQCSHVLYPIYNIVSETKKDILNVFFAETHLKNKPLNFNLLQKEPVKVIQINHDFNIDLSSNLLFEQENSGKTLSYRVRYKTSEIDEVLLARFIDKYKTLFLSILNDLVQKKSEKLIKDYSILNTKEYQQIVYDWNKTKTVYPSDKTIPQLFEEQVDARPDNVAIICDNVPWTYRALNEKANQLSHYIKNKADILPDSLIVVCLDSNEFLIITLLAILKSGGACVPINPLFPKARIQYIVKNTKATMILTLAKYKEKFDFLHDGFCACLHDIFALSFPPAYNKNSVIKTQGHHLAYVLYTSGTTGKPKGVMIEHQNVISLVKNVDYVSISSSDRIFELNDITFDAVLIGIWGSLLNGSRLYLVSNRLEWLSNGDKIEQYLHSEQISILVLTQAMFEQLYLSNEKIFSQLTYLIIGGGVLNYELVKKLCSSSHKPKYFINAYGPTENTTISCAYRVNIEELSFLKIIPVGLPINNRSAYILSDDLTVLPIGAIGELYLGGAGLARGYLEFEGMHNPFITNPFITNDEKKQQINDRLYKSGDRARRLLNGHIEFIGRNDSQVKIGGYRIELGEIENKLIEYPGIKQAFVTTKNYLGKKADNKYLIAYYVAKKTLDISSIRDYITTQLPSYMCPSTFIYLKKLPLTINGKINEKALPHSNLKSLEKYFCPTNDKERLICELFSQVLKSKFISVQDDFFALGGNSLDAIRLTSLLQEHFSVKVADIFSLRTPKKMAQQLQYDPDVLKKTLCYVKTAYHQIFMMSEQSKKELEDYTLSYKNLIIDEKLKKNIKNVLLTGGTGYFGCNLLQQLLLLTDYHIFVLVRADTKQGAIQRIQKKYQFYFNKTLDGLLDQRVFVIKANIEETRLGLTPSIYKKLTKKIDSIIHSAALVKYYGEEEQFYAANVQATINLLEFSTLTRLHDFHYISTASVASVLNSDLMSSHEKCIYTENSPLESLKYSHNMYKKTKLEAEKQVIKYREKGVNCSIYRIGNLVFMKENFRTQENIQDNAFFNWLQYLLKIQCVAKEISQVQISQTDLTAKAVVKIFDKKSLDNDIYHVFNPFFVDLIEMFPIKVLSMDVFIDLILKHLADPDYEELILKFLLRQGWLDGKEIRHSLAIDIVQDKTQHILKQLHFEWPCITSADYGHYLQSIHSIEKKT